MRNDSDRHASSHMLAKPDENQLKSVRHKKMRKPSEVHEESYLTDSVKPDEIIKVFQFSKNKQNSNKSISFLHILVSLNEGC